MLKTKPFPASLVVLVVLIALHVAGSYLSWYWSYPWFDRLVHTTAGLWIGLVFLWLASYLNQISSMKEYRAKSFSIAVISAGVVGVVWELLENYGGFTFALAPGYTLNTAFDLLSDIFGGVLAYLYFIKRTRCINGICDPLNPFYGKVGLVEHTDETKS